MWGNSFRIRPLGEKRGFPSFFLPFCRVRFHGSRTNHLLLFDSASRADTRGRGSARAGSDAEAERVGGRCRQGESEASNPRGCWCLLFCALFGGRKVMMEDSCASDFRNEWPEFLDKCTPTERPLCWSGFGNKNVTLWQGSLQIKTKSVPFQNNKEVYRGSNQFDGTRASNM